MKGNYARRDRFAHNRNPMYVQRNNFYRKNRRVRFGPGSQGQFDQTAYFGTASLTSGLGLDWQRNNYTANPANSAVINHMTVPLAAHAVPSSPSRVASNRHSEETEDQDVNI